MDAVREIAGLVAFFDGDEVVIKGNGRPKDKMVGAIGRLCAACRFAQDAAQPDYHDPSAESLPLYDLPCLPYFNDLNFKGSSLLVGNR